MNIQTEMQISQIMPELVKSTSIIGKSAGGVPVVCFETEERAAAWITAVPDKISHRLGIRFYRQTIIEEPIKIVLPNQEK